MKLKSQPRIKGIIRIPSGQSLLPEVKEGLIKISREEGKSVSWVIAEIISDYFGIDAMTNNFNKIRRIK